jgi:hypothetical protein
VAIPVTVSSEQTRAHRALVRRILRVRPDVTPAQLVAILGSRVLGAERYHPSPRT